ncbi:MAG: hypothetical protein GVY32_09820 [Gammaproteobacteria bacterium]|jgi:signal transduction histidine kinase/ligand-binding sensor domain-containing protein|nr:hypothetical protein [Gammaproteobacteria bacterium]
MGTSVGRPTRFRKAWTSPARRCACRVLLFCGLLANVAVADDLGPVFRTIGVADGLPDSRVEAVVQDARGYIWFGTQGGLVRHEGDRLNVVGSDPERPDPLPGHNIMSLLAASDGSVWAAVENRGAVQIAPDLTQRLHLRPRGLDDGRLPAGNIWSMAEGCDGRIWLAFMRGGIAVYDPETDALESFSQHERHGLQTDGFQMQVLVDSDCRVWLLQSGRLGFFDPQAGRFRKVYEPRSDDFLVSLLEAAGTLYFSEGAQLMVAGKVGEAPLDEPRVVLETETMVSGMDHDVFAGEILVTTVRGLYRWDPAIRQRVRRVRAIEGLSDGLPTERMHGVMVDREGGLWMRLYRHGLAYLPPGTDAFRRYHPVPGKPEPAGLTIDPVTAITWDEAAEGFWIGSMVGGFQFLPLGEPSPASDELVGRLGDLPLGNVVSILRNDQRLLVLTQTQLIHLPLDPERTPTVLMRREEIDEGTFRSMQARADGRLWLNTHDVGLFLFDERTGQREHFHPDGKGRHYLPEPSPRQVAQDDEGRWWLVGERRIYRWREDGGFEPVLAPEHDPLAATVWAGGDLWIASDERLGRWEAGPGGFAQAEAHGLIGRLPPGRVLDLHADRGGRLWLVRSSGLARFDPASGRLRHLSRQDGLAPVEFQENASLRMPDGRIAAAGRGGLVIVDPERMRSVQVAPPVHVTRVRAGDRIVHLAGRDASTVELAHHDNSLYIDFQANSYLGPDRNRYRVRLEGWDEDWLELIGQTRHYYSRLPPGRYRFRVQAAAPDGPWNEQGDAVAIKVRRPPWLGGTAMAAYAFLALGGAGFSVRAYRRSLRRRREIRDARQKRALAEEQRQVVSRLNDTLEPVELALTIAREVRQVTGARRVCFGYVDDELPPDLATAGESGAAPTREDWRRRLDRADGRATLALSLRAEERDVARVLVEAPETGFAPGYEERLRLFEEMAGQALHNAVLLQRVRALAESAEQASSAKSEFLATMSHEIRTPLHGVLGMVELLHESETEPAQQDILDTLRQSGLQLQRIIDDVLDISRIEAGRLDLDPQPFDLMAMLEQVIDLHAPNAARKGLDLRLRVASDLPLTAFGDGDRVSQVLGNLLSNAVKFTETGGIELVAEIGTDGRLVLIVADSGPGIADEDRVRLFEPFSQLDASITRSHSGSGLGLAICRRLVDAMGGVLELLDPCHSGSRFRVRLPVFEPLSEPVGERLTGMLEGTTVCACVAPPQMRVLRRLARRWHFELYDAHQAPRACRLLLLDPLAIDEAEAGTLDEWHARAAAVAWLQSPFPSRSGPAQVLPEGAHFLRWPLVESRFIGLLLDLRITGADDRHRSG